MGRFIPAYAGNTPVASCAPPPWPVHPRLRGEHGLVLDHVEIDAGSSPPTRGTQDRELLGVGGYRFIPAYAGNTGLLHRHVHRPTVHPRLRGEHMLCVAQAGDKIGSSPPTRGTLLQAHVNPGLVRFIPAYAGNTIPLKVGGRTLPVHPRLRGEHRGRTIAIMQNHGSSPPTRGTPPSERRHDQSGRFIPAYAGNTL